MSFAATVQKAFGFLESDFGFAFKPIPGPSDGHAEYSKEPLSVGIWWGKGEIDINFSVSLSFAASHAIFRPYISRTFDMFEVIRHTDPKALVRRKRQPAEAKYITSLDQAQQHLAECARLMRQYCVPLLQGDLAVLEAITRKRRN